MPKHDHQANEPSVDGAPPANPIRILVGYPLSKDELGKVVSARSDLRWQSISGYFNVAVASWPLTSLQARLIKISACVVRHARAIPSTASAPPSIASDPRQRPHDERSRPSRTQSIPPARTSRRVDRVRQGRGPQRVCEPPHSQRTYGINPQQRLRGHPTLRWPLPTPDRRHTFGRSQDCLGNVG